ncbi:MAG: YdcH family protein [Pseudomonadota bacterium]
MAVIEYVRALTAKHSDLEQQLEEEASRPLPSSEAITRMKREKLRLKDQIAQMSAHQA